MIDIHGKAVITDPKSDASFEFLAHHDALTGLPNGLLFKARGELALARAGRISGRVAVMSLGLDFALVEDLDDTLGSPAGNGLLRMAAERVAVWVRADDTVGRLGGDEFTVLLDEITEPSAVEAVARKILDALAVPFEVAGNQLFISACIGVSIYPEDGDDLATLIKHAANAMHRARGQANGSVHFYTAELTRAAVDRFQLERDLRQAVVRNELVLHFQPQVSVRLGRIVGVEALVRWHRPSNGFVLPGEFIPLAEQSGLIEELGDWVLRNACFQVRDWMASGLPPLRMAVNLSAREISAPDLVPRIRAALESSGIDPGLLELEVTESAVMSNPEAAVVTLEAVKALGVTVALDDFGAAYSSLNYIRHLPFDRLKLDGSFMRDLAGDATCQAITRAVLELGRGLECPVIAEWVESEAQLDFLRANGCDAYQGHLFAAALPASEVEALLRRSQISASPRPSARHPRKRAATRAAPVADGVVVST